MNVADPTNITGLSTLISYDGDKNVEKIEKNIIGNIDDTTTIDDVDKYRKSLEELGRSLGVTLEDDEIPQTTGGNGDDTVETFDTSFPHAPNDRFEEDTGGYTLEQPRIDDIYDKVPAYTPNPESYLGRVTEEQKKQRILNHVLAGVEDQKFSVDKEKEG